MPLKDKDAYNAYCQKYRQANKERLFEYLSNHPCVDCGENDVVVLEFDHLPEFEKKFNIGRAVGASTRKWATIQAEIDKCEVVCSNDHKRRTAKRSGSWWKELLHGLDAH